MVFTCGHNKEWFLSQAGGWWLGWPGPGSAWQGQCQPLELGTWSELGPSLGWHHHQETGDRNLKVRLGPAAECWPGYIQASAPPGDSWENMDGSHILIQDIYTGGRNGQAYCGIEMVHSQYEFGQDNLSLSRSAGRGCALVCCLRHGKQTPAALRAGSHQQNARWLHAALRTQQHFSW